MAICPFRIASVVDLQRAVLQGGLNNDEVVHIEVLDRWRSSVTSEICIVAEHYNSWK
jgi:hypothetical protein